jgi:diketogulonate reductase-like aldo/keto reductase
MGWDLEVRKICQAQGILYQGFSLLTANRDVLADPAIHSIAARVKAGIPQLVFRFAQRITAIPNDLDRAASFEEMMLLPFGIWVGSVI